MKMHDIGLYLRQQRSGRDRVRGAGRRRARPHADPRRDGARLPAASGDLLSYLEAILRIYNQYGRRDNLYKSRIKILVQSLGIDAHAPRRSRPNGQAMEKRRARALPTTPSPRWRGSSRRPMRRRRRPTTARSPRCCGDEPAFARWVEQNTVPAQGRGPRHRHHLAEGAGRHARRLHAPSRWSSSPISPTAMSQGEIRVDPRAESGAAACPPRRSAGAVARARRRRGSAPRISGSRATSSPAPASIIAASPTARSIPVAQRLARRWRRASARSAICKSRFPAASMPAAITMSAISAFWASIRTARNSTRSPSAAAPTRTPRSGAIVGPAVKYDDVVRRRRQDRRRLSCTCAPTGERFPETYRRVGNAALQGGALCRSLKAAASSPTLGVISPTTRRCRTARRAFRFRYARWHKERDALAALPAQLGLRLPNDVAVAKIAADLDRFALIVLNFPKFTDGRAYSQARLLRARYRFSGELRAAGEVLRDQLLFMRRVGFDAFAVERARAFRELARSVPRDRRLLSAGRGSSDVAPQAPHPRRGRRFYGCLSRGC